MSTFFGFIAILSFFAFPALMHYQGNFNPFGKKFEQIENWVMWDLFIFTFSFFMWAATTGELCK